MSPTPLDALRTQAADVAAEAERATTCVRCLASGSQDWCRLRLAYCPVLNRPTQADRRAPVVSSSLS